METLHETEALDARDKDEYLHLLEAWIKAMPEDQRKRKFYAKGGELFSPEDILQEVHNGTSHGKEFCEEWQYLKRAKAELQQK